MKLLGIISVGFNITDQVLIRFFLINQILGKKWDYNETVYQIFLDFKKANDSIQREVLYNILTEFLVPMKLVRLIKMCLNKPTVKSLQVYMYLSLKFSIQNGITGDASSPLLFNFALEYAIRKVQEK